MICNVAPVTFTGNKKDAKNQGVEIESLEFIEKRQTYIAKAGLHLPLKNTFYNASFQSARLHEYHPGSSLSAPPLLYR
jgi:hypothetical protein